MTDLLAMGWVPPVLPPHLGWRNQVYRFSNTMLSYVFYSTIPRLNRMTLEAYYGEKTGMDMRRLMKIDPRASGSATEALFNGSASLVRWL